MGLVSAFVAEYSNTATSAPIYICATLYIAMVSDDLPLSCRYNGAFETDAPCRLLWQSSCRSSHTERDLCREQLVLCLGKVFSDVTLYTQRYPRFNPIHKSGIIQQSQRSCPCAVCKAQASFAPQIRQEVLVAVQHSSAVDLRCGSSGRLAPAFLKRFKLRMTIPPSAAAAPLTSPLAITLDCQCSFLFSRHHA